MMKSVMKILISGASIAGKEIPYDYRNEEQQNKSFWNNLLAKLESRRIAERSKEFADFLLR